MTNNTDGFEKKLHSLSQQTFNKETATLDKNVLQRLRQAREMAVSHTVKETADKNKKTIDKNKKTNAKIEIIFPSWLSPVSTATAFASIAIISALLLLQTEPRNNLINSNLAENNLVENSVVSPFDDIALLSSNDDIELYEDIAFYIWLDDEEVNDKNKPLKNTHEKKINAG